MINLQKTPAQKNIILNHLHCFACKRADEPSAFPVKMFYNQYTFSSDEGLRTLLIEKISKSEKVSPESVKIEKIDSYGKEKRTFVVAYYKTNNSEQKSKTFIYNQAIFGRIVVGKDVK